MLPDSQFTVIDTSEKLIRELLNDLFIQSRHILKKWSDVTRQTMQVRIAYPGQHLASLITGVEGSGSAARGFDLEDRSEIKTCSRADQLGRCESCEAAVLPQDELCRICQSKKIKRMTDSHWIFSVKSEGEKKSLLSHPRIILLLFDRQDDSPSDTQIRAWEIWPLSQRHSYFKWFVEDYWNNNFCPKRKAGKDPAPLNLHPLKYDFHRMNPLPIFEAVIEEATSEVNIKHWVKPTEDRSQLESEPMPAGVATKKQLIQLVEEIPTNNWPKEYSLVQGTATDLRKWSKEDIVAELKYIPEEVRNFLPKPVKQVKMD